MTITSIDHDTEAVVATGSFQACVQFEADHLDADGPCLWCGWLRDDHFEAPTSSATVLELPRRPVRPLTIRRAS